MPTPHDPPSENQDGPRKSPGPKTQDPGPASPSRIVVKIGSNVLSLDSGGLDGARIAALVAELATVHARGTEIVVVSSGAVSAGRGILGLAKRPTEIPELQAVAAIGQCALMETWAAAFRARGIVAAQMLLTRDDMDDRRRYLNAKLALVSILHHRAIPVINENDTVTIDELKFGDNDMLSAMVAAKMDADLLVILSNVPGLMTAHPREPGAQLVRDVAEITPEIEGYVGKGASSFGTGGMKTKLGAARHATSFGVPTLLIDGREPRNLAAALSGAGCPGTRFLPRSAKRTGGARLHWIATARPRGELRIDDGAVAAVSAQRRSLLPVGIREIAGEFAKGDVVAIADLSGRVFAHGIVNFDDGILALIKGKKGPDLSAILGEVTYREAIHRDNLCLL